ncbi:MarR family winged helix-turn-helix transcriptional regulator [Peterkaempfera bronchialis]|uniref:MarR family transcriptional regulator n=1 Tax=Peterkaempfera bronchialis TaxID=2126346 RepID=A0A345T709_9ACTN|nr:MarR family transcriptional regulator [Peterkaempfera bronchialis]AXI81764.1 MarR family transcriptional regulator [Peterkaempfera bronchialis]
MRQWQLVRPDLDTAPMAVIGRLNRCTVLLQQAAEAPLARAGLTRAEFDILGTLRRVDHELTPGQLARETFASGAAVTKRLRSLAERGLVVRRTDVRDRRVAHVSLTDEGLEIIDRLMPEQLGYESALLAGMGEENQEDLADLLGRLLIHLEGRLGSRLPV